MVKETAGQEFLLTTGILLLILRSICFEHLLFICSFRLGGVFRGKDSVELISQSYQKSLP